MTKQQQSTRDAAIIRQAFSEPRCTCSHKRPQGALYHETHCEVLQWSATHCEVLQWSATQFKVRYEQT